MRTDYFFGPNRNILFRPLEIVSGSVSWKSELT
jgi:hypothetical protein